MSAIQCPHPETNEINQKFLRGVQGGGFFKKSPPGRPEAKVISWQAKNKNTCKIIALMVEIKRFRWI
jgi:hypothetical protein